MEQSKVRYEFIDLAKGFCILLVAFLHIVGKPFPDSINATLTSFRMPLYFILSGMFFSRYGGMREFTIKKVNKLLIPFLFCWLIRALVCILYYARTLIVTHSTSIDWPYLFGKLFDRSLGFFTPVWFLLCLFFCGIFFYAVALLCDVFKGHRIVWLMVISMAVGTIGFLFGKFEIHLPLWIDTALTALPFYSFGYILRKETTFLQETKYRNYYLLIALLLFVLTYFLRDGSGLRDNYMVDASYIKLYISGILGTMAVLLLSKRINKLPVISYLGRYSICILMTHFLFVPILFNTGILEYVTNLGIDALLFRIIYFIVVMLSYLLIIPFMIKFMPHVCAQKNIIK